MSSLHDLYIMFFLKKLIVSIKLNYHDSVPFLSGRHQTILIFGENYLESREFYSSSENN